MKGYVSEARKEEISLGIEIESFGISRKNLAYKFQEIFPNSTIHHETNSHGLDDWSITTIDNKVWHIVSDSSITDNNGYSAGINACEVNSPVLTLNDFSVIEKVVTCMKKAGLKVNSSCGIHVHASHEKMHDAKVLSKLLEHDITRSDMIQLSTRGKTDWAEQQDIDMVKAISKMDSIESIKEIWYKTYAPYQSETNNYNRSRYHGTNLHSYFLPQRISKKNVEFRYFDSTLDIDTIKAYMELSAGLLMDAINSRYMRRYLYQDRPYDLQYDGTVVWKAESYLYKYVDLWLGYLDRMKISAQSKRILTKNFHTED